MITKLLKLFIRYQKYEFYITLKIQLLIIIILFHAGVGEQHWSHNGVIEAGIVVSATMVIVSKHGLHQSPGFKRNSGKHSTGIHYSPLIIATNWPVIGHVIARQPGTKYIHAVAISPGANTSSNEPFIVTQANKGTHDPAAVVNEIFEVFTGVNGGNGSGINEGVIPLIKTYPADISTSVLEFSKVKQLDHGTNDAIPSGSD